ncbi:MAG: hypothetical protein ACO36A_05780 [Ilumatobacteraceae bacterium]
MNTETRFDADTGRWHLTATGRVATQPFVEEAPGVWVARDDNGEMAECLVADEATDRLPEQIRQLIGTGLGVSVAQLGDPAAARALVRRDTADVLPGTRAIHEPGIPYADRDGAVRVPTPDGEIAVTSSDSVLMIDVPMRASHEWVRVSDAETGGLLALGRIHPTGSGLGANITFGLDDNDIHITLTDTPLDPVADRRTRRFEWLDGVIADMRRMWWRRPLRTRAAARDAVAVARALGDDRRAATAARYARLLPAYVGAASVVAVISGTLGIGALVPQSGPQLVVTGASTATYAFGGRESATVSVDVTGDGSLSLMISDRVLGPHPFRGADVSAARAACIAAQDAWVDNRNVRTVSVTYAVTLRSGDRDPVLVGTVTMASATNELSSVEESCRNAPVGADGSVVAEVVHQRETEEFTLPSPDGIDDADTWSLALERVKAGAAAGTGSADDPVSFRVEG